MQHSNDKIDINKANFDEPQIIRVEGKSNDMINRPLIINNDSINILSENYDTNNNLIVNDKLKENNYLKKKKSMEKNILNKQNQFEEDTSEKDLIC